MNASAARATGSESRLVKVLDEYLAALQRGDPTDKSALLAAHPDIAEDLEACLASLDFIRRAAASGHADVAVGDRSSDAAAIGLLGDFRIIREAGRGGMGVVYEAEQLSLGRRVALKVLPFAAALDPRQLARFRVEAQAAAQLHHTNIVPVFSVGSERGVYYYAMEFIEGRSLAEVIRELRQARKPTAVGDGQTESELSDDSPLGTTPGLTTSGRPFFEAVAQLGIQAAEALEYAHSLGIIHRDVKPANFMLDARGNLWVTDFGLARFHDDAGLTMTGDVLGTLRYMSPEQALAKRVLVDERTDVYSLGVTLYELPTLRPAFDGRDRQELLRQIAFEEPPPPRHVDPAIPRALETVVLKAMAKEPEGRYASAQELADDLRRFLEHRAVRAKRPSLVERAAKWSRRHRTVMASIAVILMLATAGLGTSTVLIAREHAEVVRQRDQARTQGRAASAARDAEASARRRAEDSKKTARAEADKAEAINRFLIEDLLTQAEPAKNAAEDHVTLLEVLDRAATKVGNRFRDQPEVEDALRRTIAQTYHVLASWEKAERQLRVLLESSRRRYGLEAVPTLIAQKQLGHILYDRGRLAEALDHLKAADDGLARVLGADHPETAYSQAELALVYKATGHTPEAIPLLESALKFIEAKLGNDHPDTLIARNNLATAYYEVGRIGEAIVLHELALRRKEATLGADHPLTFTSRNNVALTYLAVGRVDASIALQESNLKRAQARLGPDHPETVTSRNNLGAAYVAAGRILEGIALHESAVKSREATLGPDHPATLYGRESLAHAFETLGRWDRAEPVRRDVLGRRREANPTNAPALADALCGLGGNLLHQGRWSEAERLLREGLAIRERTRADAWGTFDARSQYGGALLGLCRYAEAEPLDRLRV